MKKVINVQEAKTHLSRYLEQVADGEDLLIGKSGKPMAMLVPYKAPAKPRKLGALAGKMSEESDAWTSETDAELAAELFGESLDSDTAPKLKVAEAQKSYQP